MKKIIGIGSLVLFSAALVLQPSLADQSDLQSRIQETISRYEKIKEDLPYFDTTLASGFDTKQAVATVNALGEDISSVVADIEAVQAQKKDNDANYEAVLSQVKRVIIDINETKKTVSDAVMKINIANKDIADTISSLQDTRNYIIAAKESLSKLVELLYMVQNDYYAGAGNIDDIKLLLKSDNISDTLSADEILNALTLQFNTLVTELTDHQQLYTQQYSKLTEMRSTYKATVLSYQDKMQALQEQKAYLMDFLRLYKSNKLVLDAQMNNLFQTRAQLKAKIATMVRNIRDMKINLPFVNSANYKGFLDFKDDREQRKNFFLWPVLPAQTIEQYFSTGSEVSDDDFVGGIKIAAKQYDAIYAPANGIVYKVSDQDGISINWMVLVHNTGYVTVFTNINTSFVHEGDTVKRGQIIGLVGGQQ